MRGGEALSAQVGFIWSLLLVLLREATMVCSLEHLLSPPQLGCSGGAEQAGKVTSWPSCSIVAWDPWSSLTVESVSELTLDSWQGGESESTFDSLQVQQEGERETALVSWQ